MRGIIAIVIGAVFLACASGAIPMDEVPPASLRVLITIVGAALIWAGLWHSHLRFKGYRAYHGGRDKRGLVRLVFPVDSEDGSIMVVFMTERQSWFSYIDAGRSRSLLPDTDTVQPATAYFGEDDRFYALEIAGTRMILLSAGTELTPAILTRLRVENPQLSHGSRFQKV